MNTKQNNLVRVLIVDDEREACDNLEAILTEYASTDITIVGKATDTRQAEALIKMFQPDLVFLDIHMPDETGVDFLSRIEPYSFEIIFVTAFDGYALRAFKLNAIDYILKPISIQEIVTALEKTREKLVHKRMMQNNPEFYNKVLSQVYTKTSADQFTFRDKNTVHVVPFEDIIYLEGMGSYSKLYYRVNGRERNFVLSHSIAEYEQLLPQELFYRVHKSYLINRVHVVNVSRSGSPTAMLSSNCTLPVGRRRLSSFLSFLNGAVLR